MLRYATFPSLSKSKFNTQSRTFETWLPTLSLKLIKLITLYCDY